MSTLDSTKPLGCLIGGVPFLVRNDYCIFFLGVGNLTSTIGLPPQLHVAPAGGDLAHNFRGLSATSSSENGRR